MSNTPRVFVSHCSHDDNHADTVVNILRQIVPVVEIKHYRDPNLPNVRSKLDSDKILQDADVFLILYSKQYEDSDPSMRELENGYHRDVKREIEMVIVKLDSTRLPSVMQGKDYISISDPDLSIKLTRAVQAAASRVRAHQGASQTPPPTAVVVIPQRPPPLSKTREARENPDARWHGSTRDIQTLGDWTIHFHPAGVMWRDEAFKEVVQNRAKVVPAKLLYASYEGTQAWLNKCAASSYRFLQRITRFTKKQNRGDY